MAGLTPAHVARLRERKLDPSLCARLGVHSLPGAIGFSYRVQGREHNVKIRRGKGNMPWLTPGLPLVLWNLDSLRGDVASDEAVIITEGEFDCAAVIQAGFDRCVSLPNGAQTGEHGFQCLFTSDGQLIPELAAYQRFVIATDGDAKGRACRDALAIRLGEERCVHVVWPEGCKDANDVLMQLGERALADLIDAAKPMLVDEICTMDDVPEPEEEQRYRVGMRALDQHGFRITLPAFWPVIGPYGSGKSVLLRQILCSLWKLHGWRCLLTSFEERIKPRYQRDLRRHIIGRASTPDAPWTPEELAVADGEIRNGFAFMKRKRSVICDAEWALDRIEYAVRVYGIRVVAIDPFNKIRVRGDRGQSKSDAIGDFLTRLKELGDDYGLLTIILAHTPKDGTEKRLQRNGILTLNDGEDSRHWGTDADIGWCVWRNVDGPTMLHIDKLKDHETMGQPTLAELVLDRARGCFDVSKLGYDILSKPGQQ